MSSLFRGLKIQFCDKTERTELREIRHLGFKINQIKLLVDPMSLEDTARETRLTPYSEKLLQKKCYRSRQNSILLHTVRIIKTIKLEVEWSFHFIHSM